MPAKPGALIARNTAPPGESRIFFTIFDWALPRVSVTSSTLSPTFPTSTFRSFSFCAISIRPCCLCISCSITLTSWSSCCTPLTSTTAPFCTEMLTSCLMLPSPRATRLLARKSLPSVRATCIISSGLPVTGSSAISTSGTPSLSRPYFLICFSPPINFAASSSRQMLWTPTFLPSTTRWPPVATSIVRWNPVVFEPSMTILRMTCTSSITLELSASENTSAVSRASLLTSWGGSSSASTRQLVPAAAWYLTARILLASNIAAGS